MNRACGTAADENACLSIRATTSRQYNPGKTRAKKGGKDGRP